MRPKLGIVAGAGGLPGRLAAACRGTGRPVFVVAIEGEADPTEVGTAPHAWVPLAAVGKTLRLLRQERCEEVVLAGAIRRPSLTAIRPDWRGAALLARLAGLRDGGDDGLLSLVVKELESEGFRVVGADDVLADLLAPLGAIGGLVPDDGAGADIRVGVRVVRALGGLDVGQAAVVQQGRVLGVEAAEGTDALLRRCGALRMAGPGGVLVKLRKPHQERRADLPAVGVETVNAAAGAGLRGIAIEAGATLLFGREDVARAADGCGVFVIGVDAEDDHQDACRSRSASSS